MAFIDDKPARRPLPVLNRTPAEIARLRASKVSYMEITGHFSCPNCNAYRVHDGFCERPAVQAHVSRFGCCNLFYPANSQVIFPPEKR